MDVYWINCFLACTLAFIAGHYYAERKFKHALVAFMSSRSATSVTSDVKLH